ncbi:MAG: vitamin K epoxide reductase family protein [Planctomycetaceae bacterium]
MPSPQAVTDADLNVVAPPWDYNPSAWSQRIPVCILAGIATVLAAYMAAYQWGLVETVWDPVFGTTDDVLDSKVAKKMHAWFRIPDAAFGAFAYLGDAVFGLAGSTRRWQYRPWLVILFGIDVIPLGIVSAILVVLQGTVVGDWCLLCLITAVISLVLIVFAYDEVWSCLKYLHRVWQRTRSWRILWKTFCGLPTPEAAEVALEFASNRA